VGLARSIAAGALRAAVGVVAAMAAADGLDWLGTISVRLDERALERATSATGPFAGVPILLKDAGQELAGTPCWMGTQALRRIGYRSAATTPLAARLEELGFVVIGKAAVSELMTGITTEPPGAPPCRNPWDPSLTVGGSSGGSAAAVAAGIVAMAHGSDSSGSLRYPASCCGVLTLKPSTGRVPASPPPWLDDRHGAHVDFVLARSARDLRRLLAAVASPPPEPARGGRAAAPIRRVGVLAAMPYGLGIEAVVAGALSEAADRLAGLGAEIVELPPGFLERYGAVLGAERSRACRALPGWCCRPKPSARSSRSSSCRSARAGRWWSWSPTTAWSRTGSSRCRSESAHRPWSRRATT
jgi:amidase